MADMTKVMLYVCLGASALGGASHAWMTAEREQADKDRKRALQMLARISAKAEDIATLEAERDQDEWVKQSANNRHQEFFATCARDSGLPRGPGGGNPKDTTPTSGRTLGFQDRTYELTWRYQPGEQKGFPRENIAQFLWRLEDRPLLKVTELRLSTDDRTWNDLWDPRISVTERKPTGGGADT